jgi:hypothetical protein
MYYGPDLLDNGPLLYAANADECCIACMLRPGCGAWVFMEEPTDTLHICMLRSSIDYIILKDRGHPDYAISSGAKNWTTAQFPPPTGPPPDQR